MVSLKQNEKGGSAAEAKRARMMSDRETENVSRQINM